MNGMEPWTGDPAALLRWYLDMGVDEAIVEAPVDRYGAFTAARAAAARPSPPPPTFSPEIPASPPLAMQAPAAPARPSGDAVRGAYEAAHGARTVAELRDALDGFDGCALKRTATNTVFLDGNPQAPLVLVGEAPGAEEDRRGLPFVGPSGHLLDRMLASIGLDRTGVLITNTVFWRPPGNRAPTTQEIGACQPFLERLIELVDPRMVVALGGPAAKTLLARAEGITKLRGRWFTYASPGMARPIDATAVFHPAYLLRTPAAKRDAWRDLLAIRERLADSAPD